jgi:AcrR family transcriptional regulator
VALDALVELFWRRGYEHTTQEVMLTATGLSSSSLYRTFGTKAETFEAVLRRYLELVEEMIAPVERGGGTADLHALLDRIAATLRDPNAIRGCLVVATVQDPVNHNPRVSALTDCHLTRLRAAIHTVTTRAHAAGEPLPADPHAFADAFYAAALGILVTARSGELSTSMAMLEALRALLPERAVS